MRVYSNFLLQKAILASLQMSVCECAPGHVRICIVCRRAFKSSQRLLFHLCIHSAITTASYLGPCVQVGETEAWTRQEIEQGHLVHLQRNKNLYLN